MLQKTKSGFRDTERLVMVVYQQADNVYQIWGFFTFMHVELKNMDSLLRKGNGNPP